jgi:Flp pilus assembly protein TadB
VARERFSTSRAQLRKAEKARARRSRENMALARRLGLARRVACALMALGGAGIAAGVVLAVTGHLLIAALPVVAGALVLRRGERMLARIDTIIRKQLYGDAAALWVANGPGRVGGTNCAAGHGNCGGGGVPN